MTPAVAYLRVSTRKQGESGLGIDAQRAAVDAHCRQHALNVIDEFREVESGARSDRPVLRAAIDRALEARAVLVIARLDRLARSYRFIDELLESGDLQFVACDVPSASPLVFRILAAIAQEEAAATSIRTRAAMQAAKSRGAVFGNPGNLTRTACYNGARATNAIKRRKRDRIDGYIRRRVLPLYRDGASYRQIAGALNSSHVATPYGKRWTAGSVWRALQRIVKT